MLFNILQITNLQKTDNFLKFLGWVETLKINSQVTKVTSSWETRFSPIYSDSENYHGSLLDRHARKEEGVLKHSHFIVYLLLYIIFHYSSIIYHWFFIIQVSSLCFYRSLFIFHHLSFALNVLLLGFYHLSSTCYHLAFMS